MTRIDRRKWRVFIAVSLVCFVVSYFLLKRPSFADPTGQPGFFAEKKHFVPLKIGAFSRANIPQLDVEVEHETISAKVDLGWAGGIGVPKGIIQKLEKKAFIKRESSFGLRGKTYECDVYEVPEIHIGKMKIFPMRMAEENLDFSNDSVLKKGEKEIPEVGLGRVGWYVFKPFNVLLDCEHSAIVICDSLDTLKQQGYATDSFIEAPLLLDRDSLDFEALTEEGPLRCTLDTGATWNLLNRDLENLNQGHRLIDLDHLNGRPKEFNPNNEDLLVFDENDCWDAHSFQVGGKNFGPIKFTKIKSPVGFDAVIGMEFIDNHLIFIDFRDEKIYFSKLPEERSPLVRVYTQITSKFGF